MKYYRDSDYFLYFENMPVARWLGYIKANSDGTVSIYINSRANVDRQQRALKHELRHLAFNHLWDEDRPITDIEDEADGDGATFGPNFAWVECEDELETRGNVAAVSLPTLVASPQGGLIPLYESADAFLQEFVRRASPRTLALMRQAGWNG